MSKESDPEDSRWGAVRDESVRLPRGLHVPILSALANT
jgi:hypothetical protein